MKILKKFRQTLSVLLIISLLLSQLTSLFVPLVYAASSPWSQTNWNGGSGQTSWSDTTKYDSSSSVTTSTANQVTLTQTSSWYNASWAYRKKITFDNSSQAENLTNFPALVKLSSSNFDFTKAQSSGQDIRFTDSDGTTALSYEIESYSNSSSAANIWVKVPQVDASSSTDYMYLYYGNSSATDSQDATSVWDSNFKAVYHLKETGNGTSGEYKDSTSNANNLQGGGGTATSVPTLTTSGQVDGAQSFDGTNDYSSITSPSGFPTGTSARTFSFWFNTNSFDTSSADAMLGSDPTAEATGNQMIVFAEDNAVSVGFLGNRKITPKSTLSTGTWYNVAVVIPSGASTSASTLVYINGVSQTLSDEAGSSVTLNTSANFFTIGDEYNAGSIFPTGAYNGFLDEVKVSNTARSAAWIAASYKSEVDTFNTFASEEQEYSSSGTLTSSIFDVGTTGDWGTLTYSATTPTSTSLSVKIRTGDNSSLSDATAFSSCTAITSGSNISSNSCVTKAHRYAQYLLTLSTSAPASTPTFSSFSLGFALTAPALDSPNDNNYINNNRPSFKFKTSDVSSYRLYVKDSDGKEIFSISGIPSNRTTDYDQDKYTAKYEGFSDSDTTNNYITVYTKSHSSWSSSENDGNLKSGKNTWAVAARDGSNNEAASERTIFVDKTSPKVELTQINTTPFTSSNYSTTSKKPTIFGKITDSLGDSDSTKTQDENGPKVASAPKEVNIKIEKKEGSNYKLVTLYKINMDNPYYTCEPDKTIDNSKQKCDKYLPFEYTPKENLDLGTYKITLSGKDKADNSSSETTLTLNITTLSQITTPAEKKTIEEETKTLKPEEKEQIKQELEITKPTEEVSTSALEKAGESITQTGKNFFGGLGTVIHNVGIGIGNEIAFVFNKIDEGLAFVFDKTGQGLSFVGNGIGNEYNNIAYHAPGVTKNILLAIGNGFSTTGNFIRNATGNTIANIAFTIGEKTDDVSHGLGITIIKTGYLFVPEPTKIYDVQVIVLSPTSAKISWKTNHPANGKVNYGLDETYPFDIQTEKRTNNHEFTLTNLKPDTQYYFEVMSHNKNYVYDANRKFKTPSVAGVQKEK